MPNIIMRSPCTVPIEGAISSGFKFSGSRFTPTLPLNPKPVMDSYWRFWVGDVGLWVADLGHGLRLWA